MVGFVAAALIGWWLSVVIEGFGIVRLLRAIPGSKPPKG
jgi:hypothetical protein